MKRLLLVFYCLTQQLSSLSAQGNWDVYIAELDSVPATISVDLGFIKKAPLKDYPYLMVIDAPYKKGAFGFPETNELTRLHRIDERVKSIMSPNEAHFSYVGIAMFDGYRMYYFYSRDTAYFLHQFKKIQSESVNDDISVRIEYDAEWEAYRTFLYPPEKTLHSMQNRRTLELLQKEGDDLSKPRRVDHWVYFSTETDREKFKTSIAYDGFTIEKEEFDPGYEQPYHLQIYRTDPVEQKNIDTLNEYLIQKAREANGYYDGWETTVVE